MLKQGYVRQDGSAYCISDAALRTTTPILDQAIKLIIETGDALRAVQNGQKNLEVYRLVYLSASPIPQDGLSMSNSLLVNRQSPIKLVMHTGHEGR
jgi:hypothetical protein